MTAPGAPADLDEEIDDYHGKGKGKCEDRSHECFDASHILTAQDTPVIAPTGIEKFTRELLHIGPIQKVVLLWLCRARLLLSRAGRPYRLPRRWLDLGVG